MWVRSQDGRLTRTLMREGKAGDEFWTKAETLLYTALIGYIHYKRRGRECGLSPLQTLPPGSAAV